MIRQLFDKITQALMSAPAFDQPHANAATTLMTAILTQPRQHKSNRVKPGAGRMFRSYRPARPNA